MDSNERVVIHVLLDHGARVNDVDEDGMTACHIVARAGHCTAISWFS